MEAPPEVPFDEIEKLCKILNIQYDVYSYKESLNKAILKIEKILKETKFRA